MKYRFLIMGHVASFDHLHKRLVKETVNHNFSKRAKENMSSSNFYNLVLSDFFLIWEDRLHDRQ